MNMPDPNSFVPDDPRRIEYMALGTLLRCPALLAVHPVDPRWWQHPVYRKVIDGILAVPDVAALDYPALCALLIDSGVGQQIGGNEGLAELAIGSGLPDNWPSYEAQLQRQYRSRVVRAACHRAISELSDGEDAEQVVGGLFKALAENVADNRTVRAGDIARSVAEEIRSEAGRTAEDAVSTGFPRFDRSTRGLRPGQLVVVGARPGMGKTSWMLNAAVHFAQAGGPTLFVSLEMSDREVVARALSGLAGVCIGKALTPFAERDLERSVQVVETLPLWLHQAGKSRLSNVLAAIRTGVARHAVRLVCVDYLQLISPDKKGGNRAEDVAEVTRELKLAAGEMRVPIIAASQLNRDACGERPNLRHLRESGAIEQDADIVMLLHLPVEDGGDIVPSQMILAKHRNGATGTIDATFNRAICLFRETSKANEE